MNNEAKRRFNEIFFLRSNLRERTGEERRGRGMTLPSAVPERPSALKLLVLFFLRCFLRLACGDGGGSILGLVLEMLGLEQLESPRPVSVMQNV